jgi:dTDP-glucose pyrophosphorylase|tara:strand:+ start:11571 stop:12629 length:1059 start_codon:yes stop_codon:yes gene_type:complete
MKKFLVTPTISIVRAMKILQKTAMKSLIVVGKNRKLLGTLSDGDIRRGILSGLKYNASIVKCYFKTPYLLEKDRFSMNQVKKIMNDEKLYLLPIVNKKKEVIDCVTWEQIYKGKNKNLKNQLNDIPLIIMAGGKGTRLAPFSDILPKPLLPIENQTVIENIINKFHNQGINRFYVTINHKAKILKSFFQGMNTDYTINLIEENKPLGTAGGIKLIKDKINSDFFLTNCDVLLNTDYVNLFNFHKRNKYQVTLVAAKKENSVSYGVCELDKDKNFKSIAEKPKFNLLINTGIYVLSKKIIKLIPSKKKFDMTSLIKKAKKRKMKIGIYPVDKDSWADVGQWTEYKNHLKKTEI